MIASLPKSSATKLLLGTLLLLTACARPSIELPITTHVPKALICLDAGHGDDDDGAVSPDKKIKEKEINLTTTLLTKDHLERLGYCVVLTRNNDTFVPLAERAEFANAACCDLFVSIHFNAHKNRSAEGVEVYYHKSLDPETNPPAKLLAEDVLAKILRFTGATSRGLKQANFAVLRLSKMPAILVEGGFVTNAKEQEKLSDCHYLNGVAWGIAQGINAYITSSPPR